jgi:hypothetical protein
MHAQTPVQTAWVTRDLNATEKVFEYVKQEQR